MRYAKGNWGSAYEAIRQREQHALLSLTDTLAALGNVPDEDMARLRDSIQHLHGLFYIVALGEFNAGKSTMINALLGHRLLAEGVTPTTDRLHVVTYGPEAGVSSETDALVEWTYPADWLKGVCLVDTPGSNTVFREHEELARQFIHWADVVLFVMAANRAFAETDRLYLDLIREFRSKVVLVINQTDLLALGERDQVLGYVAEAFQRAAGYAPEVIAISAKLAQEAAALTGDAAEALRQRSGIPALEGYIADIIGERSRAQGTLLTAGRIGQVLAAKYRAVAQSELAAWRGEMEILDNVWGQVRAFRERQQARLEARLDEADKTLDQVRELAHDKLRRDYGVGQVFRSIGRYVLHLPRLGVGSASGRADALDHFLQAEAPERIEQAVGQGYAELAAEGQSLATNTIFYVNKHLEKARPELRSRLIGEVQVPHDELATLRQRDQARLLVERVLSEANLPAFVDRWAASARSAWWQALLWEVVVIVATWIASSYVKAFADERGRVLVWVVGTALVLAALGLLLLPLRRYRARLALDAVLDEIQAKLRDGLSQQIGELAERYEQVVESATGPYQRLVHSHRARLERIGKELNEVDDTLHLLEAELVELA